MKKYSQNMLEGRLLSSIIIYTIPIILTSILQLLFSAADLIVVGRFCGSISVAAVGATTSISNLMVNLFVGLSVGAGVTIAHGLGSGENDVVHNTVHTAIPLALVGGAVLTILGVLSSETLLILMGTPDNVLPLSAIYMKIYFGGITFNLLYNFCASILRAAGDTSGPLVYLSFSGVINVVLNVVFVTIFNMNVAGVALATVISQAIAAMLALRSLILRTDACKLLLRKMHFHKSQLLKILRIGLPAGIQSSLFSISNVLIQSSINSFGDVLMSGNAAAINIEGFIYATLNSFHQTAVNYIGQNVGACQYKRARKILWICLGAAGITGVVLGGLGYGFGRQLLSVYITDSSEAISCGMLRMKYVCLLYGLSGLMDVSTGALRGLGASMEPMLISVLGVCGFRIGWLYSVFRIPEYHTPEGLYMSYPISWTITFICQMVVFTILLKRYMKTKSS